MRKILFKVKVYWWQFSCGVITVIALLSLSPLNKLEVPGDDKLHHLIAYIVLAFPIALAKPNMWQWYMLGFFILSGVIELIQPYFNLYAEWLDFCVNLLGLLLGIFLAHVVNLIYGSEVS